MNDTLRISEKHLSVKVEETSKNHLKFLHLQNLLRAIKGKALRMKGQDVIKITKAVIETTKFDHPIIRAVILGILRGSKDGMFYEIKNDPKVRDGKFSFLGTDMQHVAKAAHNLTTNGLYHVRCLVHKSQDCPGIIPVIELHIELPTKVRKYRGGKAEEVEELKSHILFLTIECGELRVYEPGEELTLEMLLK